MEGYDKYESYETRDKLSSSFYENYDSHDELNPYQMLNQMKSWNKAIYLHVEDVDSQLRSALTLTSEEIRAEVSDFREDVVATFLVQADQISSKVAQTDYNGNTIASLINQTATTVSISASKINLNGYVTISSLGYGGSTIVHGNQIQTGTLTADKIQAYSITGDRLAFNTITAGQIATGAVQADHIYSGAISADKIASGAIQAYHVQAGAITAGKIDTYAIQSYHIAAGAISAGHISAGAITADMIQTGYLSADRIWGGTIQGVNINVDSNVTLGRTVYFGPSGLYYINVTGGDMELGTFGNVLINGRRVLTTDDL